MKIVGWAAASLIDRVQKAAPDGIEEWARGPVLTECKMQCPVKDGTMRDSLDVERDDERNVVIIGGGGPAGSYIYRQHQDDSLNHPVGKSHFIVDPVEQLSPEAVKYVQKHMKKM